MKKKLNQEELINQNIKIEELETSNRILLKKLKLLKIQLESQAQLQLSAFHFHRSTPLTHRSHQNLSHRNHSANGFHGKEESAKTAINKQYESLFQQLHMLQETGAPYAELETVKKQNRDRIGELEEQLDKVQDTSPDKLKTELNDDVELIKLKRWTKKQAAQIQSLQSQLEMANAEMKQTQTNLSFMSNKNESLQAELSEEKLEIAKLSSINETLKDTNKFLEEQLNDLQVEKNTLKEHNENLLKLSLQKESNVGVSDGRAHYIKQIKELEDNLKKEVVAKSEALAKLADAEIFSVKLQNELSKSNATNTEIKMSNSLLKEQIETLKENLNNFHSKAIQKYNAVSTEDKAVMVALSDTAEVVHFKNTPEDLSAIADDRIDSNDSNVKMQLYKISNELNQCKELLRVQYNLNNKYKTEMEELQKIYQKNEKTVIDCSRSLRNVLRKHEDRLTQLTESGEMETGAQVTIDEMRNLTKFKRCNYQDYVNVLDKLLHNYYVLVADLKSKATRTCSGNTADAAVNAIVRYDSKSVQTEGVEVEVNSMEKVPDENVVEKKVQPKGTATFELEFGKAVFNYFSEHLTRSTDNPKIFLTWTFMDDNEHQAYTPTISVNDGQFNCSCQYDGPWSESLREYLNERGISVEIHLVQGEISVRLAEGKIITEACTRKPNTYHQFCADFQNDNIKGSVTGRYMLKCEDMLD